MEKVYFLSDAHLGSLAFTEDERLEKEKLLVSFLDKIKNEATQVYLLGDMFDFWYEWHSVVPKGYTRFLGKLSELTDKGVKVHYFTGNHDIWCYRYLQQECGVIMHYGPFETEIQGKRVYMAHGDGLGDPDPWFRLIRTIFHSRFCQFLFSLLPDRVSLWFGRHWAKSSMSGHMNNGIYEYYGPGKECLELYTRQLHRDGLDADLFIYGHHHILFDKQMDGARMVILGDWISLYSYAVMEDGELLLKQEQLCQ